MNYNDIIGTIGVTIVLLAYFLSILKIIPPTSSPRWRELLARAHKEEDNTIL